MVKKSFIIIAFYFLIGAPSLAQCLKGDSLLKKIDFLSDSSNLSPSDQIKALSPYEKSIGSCVYNHDSVHVELFQRIGKLYLDGGNYPKGIDYYLRSIDLTYRNTRSTSNSPKDLIRGYYWLSVCYDSLHRITEKIKALDSCASIALRLRSVDIYTLVALYRLAEYFYDVGDYHRCISYADLCESLATNFARSGSKADFNVGNSYAISSLGWSVNALMFLKKYDEAKSLLEKKAIECEKNGFEYNLGVIYGSLAEVLELKGDFEKVLFYQDKAFSIEKRLGVAYNCKAILNNIGYEVWFKHYKNLDKALQYYNRALQYKVDVHAAPIRVLNSLESLNILGRMANVYALKGKYDEALKYVQLGFDKIRPAATENEVVQSTLDEFIGFKKIRYVATLIADKANIYHQKYKATGELNDIKEAVRIYKVADQFLEKLKKEQSDFRSKLYWRSDARRLYESAIEACYSYRNLADAFYFFERSRAMLLYDELSQLRLMNDQDISRQALLNKNLAALQAQMSHEDKTSDHFRAIQEQLLLFQGELDQLNEQISTRNPFFYQHLSDTDQINVKNVQKKLLKGNDRLLEFFDGDSAVYAMMISPNQVFLEKINKDSFDRSASQLVSFVSDYELLNKNFAEFVDGSHKLYQLIFSHYDLPAGKLVVSFDGHYFPIEALVTKKGASPTYLVQNHSVSYAHSARMLMIDFDKTSASGLKNFLGVAPVNFHEKLNLPSLMGSDGSLQILKSNFRSSNCIAFNAASKSNFLSEFPAYEVIQLYTHASDSGNLGEPEIFFADSVLRLSELLAEKKSFAKLIVLSACETGSGQLYKGEGVFSFNRGFAALGIPSSVSNLWSVDNLSTYHLTELFYKYLARGLPMDEALQKAKLEFMKESPKEKALPYYWAGAILAGKTDAIRLQKSPDTALIVLLITISCGILVFAYAQWNKRRRISN